MWKLAEWLRAQGLRVWFDDWVIRAVPRSGGAAAARWAHGIAAGEGRWGECYRGGGTKGRLYFLSVYDFTHSVKMGIDKFMYRFYTTLERAILGDGCGLLI